jgi:hypothetical protein
MVNTLCVTRGKDMYKLDFEACDSFLPLVAAQGFFFSLSKRVQFSEIILYY